MTATIKVTVWQKAKPNGKVWFAASVKTENGKPIIGSVRVIKELGVMSKTAAKRAASDEFDVDVDDVIVDEFFTSSEYTPRTANPRIRVTESARVTAAIPAEIAEKLVAPDHWSDKTKSESTASGWEIFYAIADTGESIWDSVRFSHVPAGLDSPSIDVLASNAPDWWDADGAIRVTYTGNAWVIPTA